jgi:hypothetical protein
VPFRLSLYRAPDGLGPPQTWESEHSEPLGSAAELKAAIDGILPGLRWTESSQMLFASGPFDGEEHAIEITLFMLSDDPLLEIDVYAYPPPIRALMSGLRLNYCYAQESGDLYFPFNAGDHWPA